MWTQSILKDWMPSPFLWPNMVFIDGRSLITNSVCALRTLALLWPLPAAFDSSSFSIHILSCGKLIWSPCFSGLSHAKCHLMDYGPHSLMSGANPGPTSCRQDGSHCEGQTLVLPTEGLWTGPLGMVCGQGQCSEGWPTIGLYLPNL